MEFAMGNDQISLEDFVDLDELKSLFESFSTATGFTTTLVDHKTQKVLIDTGWRNICGDFHRAYPESEYFCQQSNKKLTSELKQIGQRYSCHCENGLVHGCIPLIIQGEQLANLFTSQVLFSLPDLNYFKKQAHKYGYDEQAYLKTLAEVPIISEDNFDSMLLYLDNITSLLIQLGLSKYEARQEASVKDFKLQGVFNTAPAGIVFLNDRTIQNTNPKMTEITGYSNTELDGQNTRMLYPDDKTFEQVGLEKHFQLDHGGVFSFCTKWQKKDSSSIDILLQSTLLDKNDPYGSEIVTVLDITELKNMERALRDSEERLRALSEASFESIFFSEKGICLDQNMAAERMFGYTHVEAVGMHGTKVIIPADQELVKSNMSSGYESPYEVTCLKKDGTTFPCEIQGRMINYQDRSIRVTALRDITARQLAEEQLRKERELFTQGPVLTITWSPAENWPILYVSPNITAILGYTPEEMYKPDFLYATIIHPDDLERVKNEVTRCFSEKRNSFEQSYRIRTKSGQYSWFYDSTILTRDEYDNVEAIRGYIFDQTELKDAEALLQQERHRLAYILEGTHVGTWEWNVQTGEAIFNERWAEMIGYSLEELSPVSIETWVKFSHPEDLKKSDDLLQKHFRGELDYYECEARMKHKNGKWVWVLDRGKVAKWSDDGKPLLMFGTHQDITDRKTAERNLQKSHLDLEARVEERTAELRDSNLRMQQEIRERMHTETALYKSEIKLEKEQATLQEANITLKVLMRKLEQEKIELEEQVSANILGLIEPYLKKLSRTGLDKRQNNYLQIIQTNLDNIVSPLVKSSVAMNLSLTPTEIQIANLIKQDKSSKEIAELLILSKQTIDKHRNNIRKKLGVTNKKVNLKTLLNNLK